MIKSLFLVAAGFCVSLAAGWYGLPRILYVEKPQPFAFSHEAHTGEKAGMSCEDCHTFRETGAFSGIPKLESCVACHSEPAGETKAELEFIEKFVKPEREPQWQVYSRQPDNAWFPHAAHVQRGKLKCEQCHGEHGKTHVLPVYRENRITGYSEDVMGRRAGLKRVGGMRMDDCVACHRENKLSHSCLDCHR